jgi:hypothetical protein
MIRRTATITVDYPEPIQKVLRMIDWPSDRFLNETMSTAADLCATNHPEEYAEWIIRVLQGDVFSEEFDEGEDVYK